MNRGLRYWRFLTVRLGGARKQSGWRGVPAMMGRTALVIGLAIASRADEGMWPFDAVPKEVLNTRYGFAPSAAWLDHLQRSAVRISTGGSGAFVSEFGLIVTNQHVMLPAVQGLSAPGEDLWRDGFCAGNFEEEKKLSGVEVDVLDSIEDVTDRVDAVVHPGASAPEALAARQAVKSAIEKESLEKTGFRSEVVMMYQGARYSLYRYRRYTDVRLVFFPEEAVAFFGGAADNFEFPRYAFDVCLVRAYENGAPARVPAFLSWSAQGAGEGDLVFSAGHPGGTRRFITYSDLKYEMSCRIGPLCEWAAGFEAALRTYAERGAEAAGRAQTPLFVVQNTLKRYERERAVLEDAAVDSLKRAEDLRFRQFVADRADLAEVSEAWREIAAADARLAEVAKENDWLGRFAERSSLLFSVARGLYRHASEAEKPDGKRLRPYREANRMPLERALFSDRPVYDDLEEAALAKWLACAAEKLRDQPSLVQALLSGRTADERAKELVERTKIGEVAERRRLYALGSAAMADAVTTDPMLALAAAVDVEARKASRVFEEQNEAKAQAYAKIARARAEWDKDRFYPDANFTLRLGFGSVLGCQEEGRLIPPFTNFGGLFARAADRAGASDCRLPKRWAEAKEKLGAAIPLNFACTCDVIGGNSGSPVVDRAGLLVGIVFDGNRQAAGADFFYNEQGARAVAVDVRAVTAVLRWVYGAERLVRELRRGGRPG